MSSIRLCCTLLAFLAAAHAAAQAGVRLSENFDAVTPPALPPGWVATTVQGGEFWVTDASNPDSPPNAAHLVNVIAPADESLDSPPVAIATAGARLAFRHRFDFGYEPPSARAGSYLGRGNLLISIAGDEYQDILAAGGSFAWGGYSGGGDSWVFSTHGAYYPVVVNLPTAAAGTIVVLRWRLTSDPLGVPFRNEWWVDSIRICDGFECDAVALPRRLAVDTQGNGVWEPGEVVDVVPYYFNNAGAFLDLTGGISDLWGPPGTVPSVVDSSASYGTIATGALGSCLFTPDCYVVGVNDPAPRPAQHWDLQLLEALSTGGTATWALHVGESFDDVPSSDPFYSYAETIFHRRITGGCAGAGYCPSNPALRKQMAVFLLKAKYGSAYVPPPAAGIFSDVPASDPFAPWVEDLYHLGITGGCSVTPLSYCPDQTVLRRQMAVFLLKTLNGPAYVAPSCQGLFSDVACPSPFADWIEDLASRQIAAGCGSGNFCPNDPNTRGQMAVFLVKTFNLKLYWP